MSIEAVTGELLGRLLERNHLAAPDRITTVVRDALAEVGWDVVVYVADHEQQQLIALGPAGDAAPRQSVNGTLAGRCFRATELVRAESPGAHLWVPLLDGVDRLGVLRLELGDDEPDPDHAPTRRSIRRLAYLIAHLLASKAAYTDAIELARQREARSIPSELIWSLLPPLTVACDGLAISGALEPAHAIAGDVFDYAISDDVAHIAIGDASGHDAQSALIGAAVLSASRAGRRRAVGLGPTLDLIDTALADFGAVALATGVFAELDIGTGVLRYVSAGHPAPLLLRSGKIVKSLEGGRRILLGIPGHTVEVGHEQLERGDWLVLYTDGVTEARNEDREFFGLDRLVDVLERAAADAKPAPETMRTIVHSVLSHQHDILQDDATVVVIQWMTGLEQQLTSG